MATIIYKTSEMKGGGMHWSLYFHCPSECDISVSHIKCIYFMCLIKMYCCS